MFDIAKERNLFLSENIDEINDVLLKKEELLNHGFLLAKRHRLESKMRTTKVLARRMDNNYHNIFKIYKELNELAKNGGDLSPASEWLLDNFYKIEEQVKEVRQNLNDDRFTKLITLANGYLKGYPRAYAIALELVSHTDGKVEEELLIEFVRAYQRVQIMSISEVWSLSLMIRIALIENIRIICGKIYNTQMQWSKAEYTIRLNDGLLYEDMDKNMEVNGTLNNSYIEHILAKIRREGLDLPGVLSYLEEKLDEYNTNIKFVIQNEHKEHAVRKISIGNSITSLHGISTLNWNDIFESISVVEEKLRKDPSKIYARMDFESRDYYRRAIERISKDWGVSEVKVANQAVNLSVEAEEKGKPQKKCHVGYYLIDKGRLELFEYLKIGKDHYKLESIVPYIGTIFSVTLMFMLITMSFIHYNLGWTKLLITGLFILIPSSDVAIYLTNYLFMKIYLPTMLPRLEFKEGISSEAATMVIIPALLTDKKSVKELVDKMEVYHLANKDDNLYFSLVGDFKDGDSEKTETDEDIVAEALNGIKRLNKEHGTEREIFYFFHRRRTYNDKQGKWMGWERKRGAVIEFNNLMAGRDDTTFYIKSGEIANLGHVKYVLTIDSDTNLIMDSAKKLIGVIAHPLNKAIYNENLGVVVDGYGIIQPRIGLNIEDTIKTPFTRIFAYGGIDPYTTAVSDIYQDVFGEGIFTGKGIYDLSLFNKIMDGKIEDNTVLSHDLLEGSLMRTGLATDIELIDGYPTKYSSYIMRLHRWVRGDWQLLRWISKDKPLSPLSKWKIVNNLRRSLLLPSLFFFIFIGAAIFSINSLILVGISAFILIFPTLLTMLDMMAGGCKYVMECASVLKKGFYQLIIQISFLPYNAYVMMDAVIRTIYRVFISKKNLLEWVTAADEEKKLSQNLKDYFIRMKASYLLTLLIIVLLVFNSVNFLYFLPLALLWSVSPYIAYKVSMVDEKERFILNKADMQNIRRICRKVWAYYEDLVKDEYCHLPPDNYQEYPPKGIAKRTSPTNIGLYLISALAARDFGYITTSQLVERVRGTIGTINRMESWKGHLYNWYDIKTLEVLRPYYVSTVDSGNFITYLLLLRQGLIEYMGKPLIDNSIIQGIYDTSHIYGEVSHILKKTFEEYGNYRIPKLTYLMNTIDRLYQVKEKQLRKQQKVLSFIETIKKDMNRYYLSMMTIKNTEELLKYGDKYTSMVEWVKELLNNPPLNKMDEIYKDMMNIVSKNVSHIKEEKEEKLCLITIREDLTRAMTNVSSLINIMNHLINNIDMIISHTEFVHLYDKKRNLFSIGYDVEKEKLTNSYYDLLASEARIASYWAIVKGEIPLRHWYKLGRALTKIDGSRALVSWTGTMFEYFMPSLILKNYKGTLLDETYNGVIKAQKCYGYRLKIPWGVSESGYYSFDFNLNYQYKAFGIPDLGLKRGLIEDIVISPYSTLLALSFDAEGAVDNIRKLIAAGMEGNYGFYEALDFTPKRLGKGMSKEIVKSFMAHHQGMGMLALDNFFHNEIMINRFHSHPMIKAGELMLQERIPIRVIITKEYKERIEEKDNLSKGYREAVRSYEMQDLVPPPCHLLSNGSYSVLINTRGEGFSKFNDIFINRWRDNSLRGDYGNFIFIKNVSSRKIWSAAYEPLGIEPDGYKVAFLPSRAEFVRRDEEINTIMEVFVSPEDNVEIRRVKIENHGSNEVVFEITSYFEIALSTMQDDIAHRAFSNLFIRTEFLEEYECITAMRRAREKNTDEKWVFNCSVYEGDVVGPAQYETSRANFIGRGRDIHDPALLEQPLSNSAGIVLDPSMSIRKVMKIQGGKGAVISFVTGYGNNREEIRSLCSKYSEKSAIQRAYELSITRSQIESEYLSLTSREMISYDNLISHLIYLSPSKRTYENIIKNNKKGQPSLWAYGISGDLPIMLVTIREEQDAPILKQALKAHEYLRIKGLKADLVILNEDESSYLQPLRQIINDIVEGSSGKYLMGKEGGVYIRNASNMPTEDITLLYSVARIVLKGGAGPFEKQLRNNRLGFYTRRKNDLQYDITQVGNFNKESLLFFNGYGGFNEEGNEYVITLSNNVHTPAPWINVISNDKFGFILSERGGGHVWAENSRENKLTPWSNDPVSDETHEIIYLKDMDRGNIWTITPEPIGSKSLCKVRHGWGYTTFERDCNGIEQHLTAFVPIDDKVKISIVKLKNNDNIKRKIVITYYLEPVLGVNEYFTKQHLVTEYDKGNDAFIIRNGYNNDFPERILFMLSSEKIKSFCGDRYEFLGSGGSKESPLGLNNDNLGESIGAGYDPCGAIQIHLELEADEKKEIAFCLGQASSYKELEDYSIKYSKVNYAKEQLDKAKSYWERITNTIKIKTPDLSMDILLNGWLVYQTLCCRLWARSAFYQSGGAFGFRDQLQDAVNIGVIFPELLKNQILLHSRHQFREGDVQHWWHPIAGDKGVRTRFSDDLLWLPYALIGYINMTGDYSILEMEEAFLEDQPLKEDEDERYSIPIVSDEKDTVYEHCIKAIEKSLQFGSHGMPLMGSGDWNDGMNRVGNEGKGESVWLGFFMYNILMNFIPICKRKKDEERAAKYEDEAKRLKCAIEENGWDGNWYKRAYYDDGTPLGSSENKECMIDSIAQSWAVLSGAADEDRCEMAMESVKRYLIKEDEGMILLFTPPFDKIDKNPGYIKSYVPGVRENGGQYTHAASWVICAFAILGKGDMASKLFNMINPINHTRTLMECSIYKTEPYALAADVYAASPHIGRGGWTWYTGAAGWLYKAGLEYILGLKKRYDKLYIDPCIPKYWEGFQIVYKYLGTEYHINVENPESVCRGVRSITVDNTNLLVDCINLIDDGKRHEVLVLMG